MRIYQVENHNKKSKKSKQNKNIKQFPKKDRTKF